MKQKHFIDSHKCITLPVIFALIVYFCQWENMTAWIYLALHGSYGFMWIAKSRIFPDKTWEKKCSIWYGLYIWVGLTLYWVSPWIIISNGITHQPIFLFFSIFMYSIGIFLHYASDMQKYTHLKLNPGELIMDGFMYKCRNINYFGELLIYLSFALLSKHWLPIVILMAFIGIVWFPNMLRKDQSLSRYSKYKEYKKRTKLIIPFLY